jgi:hypothetical protein
LRATYFRAVRLSLVPVLLLLAACAGEERPLQDVMDRSWTLSDGQSMPLREMMGTTATVVVTLDPECPFSRDYARVLKGLADDFSDAGVRFIGMYPTTFITAAAVERFVAESGMDFPQVMDPDCSLSRSLHARVTPEAFLLDGEGTLRYHGAIDDAAVRAGRRKAQVAQHYLADALHIVIAKGTTRTDVEAVGCIVECDEP